MKKNITLAPEVCALKRTQRVLIRGYTIISLDIVFEFAGQADSGLTLVMLNILCTTLLPNFILLTSSSVAFHN